ncbi:MAG: Hpt domain-containing protein [Firmicutes bacterium]|nr:Hpt domain-containing protein [Bacillota bacterium]
MFHLKENGGDKHDLIDQIIHHELQAPDEVDPNILEDFWLETKEHLEKIERNVLALENDPHKIEIVHGLLREFHTIKGLAGFVNFELIQRIAHQIETRLDDCLKGRREANREAIDLILTASDYIKRFCEDPSLIQNPEYNYAIENYLNKVDIINSGIQLGESPENYVSGKDSIINPESPGADISRLPDNGIGLGDSAQQITAASDKSALNPGDSLKEALTDATVLADATLAEIKALAEEIQIPDGQKPPLAEDEAEYLKAFIDETQNYLDIFEQALLHFEKEPENKGIVNELFRGMHTIKGMASAMGFVNLTALSHGIENVLQDIRDNQLIPNASLIELLYLGHDYLRTSLDFISKNGQETGLEDGQASAAGLLEKLREILAQLRETRASGAAPDSGQPPETPPPMVGIDPEFLKETMAGILEWVTKIEVKLPMLETSPENSALILSIRDHFQVINRLAHLVVAEQIQNIGRQAAVLLKKCASGQLQMSRTLVDWLLLSADYLKKLAVNFELNGDQEFGAEVAAHLSQFPISASELAETGRETLDGAPIPKLGNILIEQEKLTLSEVTELLARQKADAPELRLGQIGVKEGKIEPEELRDSLKVQQESMINLEPVKRPGADEGPEPENRDNPMATIRQIHGMDIAPVKPKTGQGMMTRNIINQEELDQLLLQQKAAHSELKLGQVAVAEKNKEVIQSLRAQDHEFKAISAESDNVRVSISKVDNLVDMVGELLIIQSLIEQEASQRFDSNDYFMANLMRMARITKDIQNMSMSLRMISLKSTFQKINRVARDAITQLNKNISFQMSGEETEIDRGVAEKILDPLIHLVKNAISHGIEPAPTRIALGKPAQGLVKVEASSKRGYIFIDVSDDGKGLDIEAIQRKALEKKLIEPGVNYTTDEILGMIFLPGFSTAENIDNISGRGVGLDVVKTEIQKIGGKVEINSRPGKGSLFTLKIPINLAVFNGIIISIQEMNFIIPTINVRRIIQINAGNWVEGNGKKMISVREEAYPVIPIFQALGLQNPEPANLAVVLELEQKLKALPVHGIVGKREIVLKPLGNEFSNLYWIAGASILGDGKVSLILDVENIFKMMEEDVG